MKTIVFFVAIMTGCLFSAAPELQVYLGEPFAEALHDVVLGGGIAISHPLVRSSPLERSDAFRLRDGRILVLASISDKMGEPYSIKGIAVSPPGAGNKLEAVSHVMIPHTVLPTK